MALYELAHNLMKIIEDMETGNCPAPSRIRPVEVPKGYKNAAPGTGKKKREIQKMYLAFADAKRKAEKYMELAQVKSLERIGKGKYEQGEAELRKEWQIKKGDGDHRDDFYYRTAGNGEDNNTISTMEVRNLLERQAILSNWDPAQFCIDFCRVGKVGVLIPVRIDGS